MAFPTAAEAISNPGELKELFGLIPVMIGDVVVDVTPSYTPLQESFITDRPVESGFAVTDARIIKPQFLRMEVILTDPDFSGGNIARAALSGTLGSQLTSSWRDKRDRLNEIFENNEVIKVSTTEASYDSMLILNIRPERTPQTLNAYFCTVEMREVRFVSSSLIAINESAVPKSVKAKQTTSQKTAGKRKQPKQSVGTKQADSGDTPSVYYNLVHG